MDTRKTHGQKQGAGRGCIAACLALKVAPLSGAPVGVGGRNGWNGGMNRIHSEGEIQCSSG